MSRPQLKPLTVFAIVVMFGTFAQTAHAQDAKGVVSEKSRPVEPVGHYVPKTTEIIGKRACDIVEECKKRTPSAKYKELCTDKRDLEKLRLRCDKYNRNNR